MRYPVGQVSAVAGVTVRTLHHYDRTGLLRPSDRSPAGYLLYSNADLARLRQILFNRELGFPLDEIATILQAPQANALDQLRARHRRLTEEIARLRRPPAHRRPRRHRRHPRHLRPTRPRRRPHLPPPPHRPARHRRPPPTARRALLRRAAAFIEQLGNGMADAATPDTELLLLSTTAPLGWHLAEALGIPSVGAYLQPTAPTRAFAPVVGGGRSLGCWGNPAAGRLSLRVLDRRHADAVRTLRTLRTLRTRLDLPPATPRATRRRAEAANWPVLHGFSELLVPRPADRRPGLTSPATGGPTSPPTPN
ncbi:MerR family transcriptional regulator [Streptomyces sp. NPDC090442]|uniref:MerR family transcriptional regulator n=1 Tax=Streptomyces sp. NPDC090442 TaxID=3365962 RepID=UPI003809E041